MNFCHDGRTCRKYITVEVKGEIDVDYMQIEYVYSCALMIYCNKMEVKRTLYIFEELFH